MAKMVLINLYSKYMIMTLKKVFKVVGSWVVMNALLIDLDVLMALRLR